MCPADGMYEWGKVNGGKQPYHFHLRSGRPFAFARLWERWHGPDGETVESCAILTCEANGLVRPVHDRMPVILRPDDFDPWLAAVPLKPGDVNRLLRPYPARETRRWSPWTSRKTFLPPGKRCTC
jgi:putative SOS response-associated peptidase YedK